MVGKVHPAFANYDNVGATPSGIVAAPPQVSSPELGGDGGSAQSLKQPQPDVGVRFRKWEPGRGKSVHFSDDACGTPPLDDPDAKPPSTSPVDLSAVVPGYGSLAFKPGDPIDVPPGEDAASTTSSENKPDDFNRMLTLTEEDVRKAMQDFVSRNQCYGNTCVKEMLITSIRPAQSYLYSLESFYETRHAMLKEIPFRGGTVDGPHNGAPLLPWEVPCEPDRMFVDDTKELQVPHTSEIKDCRTCHGEGFLKCYRCRGHGEVVCGFCHATGMHMHYDKDGIMRKANCSHCKGSHRITCTCCDSEGRVICARCDGYGEVKQYILLRVTFTTEKTSHSTIEDHMPSWLVTQTPLVVVYEQASARVSLPPSFPSKDLVVAAQKLNEVQRRSSGRKKKLLQQRQRVSAARLVEVQYSWRGASYTCWIHGKGNAVEAPDYPQRSRCSVQ